MCVCVIISRIQKLYPASFVPRGSAVLRAFNVSGGGGAQSTDQNSSVKLKRIVTTLPYKTRNTSTYPLFF